VYAEDGAVAEIVERNEGSADCDSSFTEIHVGQDARVEYTKINALDSGAGYSDNAAAVEEDGTVNWLMLSTGADLYRSSIASRLAGARSELQYNLGFLAADDQHLDHIAHVIHDGDSTRCDMDSRGVVMDQARAVYRGVQQVEQTTSGTKSFQDEKTIMIGNDCEADTTPQLQINNNEVEATHAATTGHIDEEDLFYLKSRGVTAAEAKREIITGMFDELIETGNDHGKDVIHSKIAATLQS
jgi:Fe-S cluster assembly protein SufD